MFNRIQCCFFLFSLLLGLREQCCAVLCCAVLCCARPYSTVQVLDSNGIGVGNGVGDGTGPLMYGTLFLFVTDFFCVLQVLYTLHSPAYSSVVYMG